MICIPIIGPTWSDILTQVAQAEKSANLLEFCFDLFEELYTEVPRPLPVVFTLRGRAEGGAFAGDESEKYRLLRMLAANEPDYLTLDVNIPLAFVKEIAQKHPEIKLIISHHDFEKTPKDPKQLLYQMRSLPGALYKIACTAKTTLDALRMLHLIQTEGPLLGMCMEEKGQITRILGSLFGAPWTFVALDEKSTSAPGQLTIDEFQSTYRLTPQSKIFGLIGNPVTSSIGHFVHNAIFRAFDLGALYVKMALDSKELPAFFPLIKQLNFKGLSVTMPLKEKVLPFLDVIDPTAQEIGAVNTIALREDKLFGYNSDAPGALDALEERGLVCGKRLVILGAGGAARAIAYEAKKRGALVFILNRTASKAKDLAYILNVEGGGLEELPEIPYDILINATPNFLPIDPAYIIPGSTIMDIHTRPKITTLLQRAQERGCALVFGEEMFARQAVYQYAAWFPERSIDRAQLLVQVSKSIIPL